jgi:WD40 repeat protein
MLTMLVVACTGDDKPSTVTPEPTPSPTASASPSTAPEAPTTPAPAPFAPTIAPEGRTPDAALNALIESLLSDDAETLERRHGDIEARERDDRTGEDLTWPASKWSARLADARRSLYAVTTAHPQTFPHDYDVMLALNVDGRREGWRFAVDGGRVVEVVILDRPSATSVAKAYERFVVLPPLENLPQPEPGYELRFGRPRTGDAGVDSLLAMLWARDGDGLLAAVAFDQRTLPIRQCPGELQPRDVDFVERRLDDLAEQAYSLHAVAEVPAGYLPAAEHLLIVVREPSPYDFELRGLLEADGRIVGLLTTCVRLPPRAFLVAPPPGGIEDLDPDRRSGLEPLDAVLDAMAANDRAALQRLIDFSEIGCVLEPLEIGAPPKCRRDEPEGTLLQVLPTAGCEGGLSRSDQLDWLFDRLLGADWVLYGVTDNGEPDPGASAFARGRVWMVLASTAPDPAPGAMRLNVTDRGIANVLTGCGPQSPEALLLRFGGDPDFLLAPPAARSALWLIEVESGRKTVLYEGGGQASARFDPDGQSVSALVHIEDGRFRSLRYDLDGRVLEQYEDRLLIRVSPDGESRYYSLLEPPTPDATRLVLEHGGEPVPLPDGERGTYGGAFSPDGSRLLIGSGRLESASVVVFTYHVVSVESGESLFTFETREPEGTDGGEVPRWSPSGRYIASSGRIDGLVVHDTETGESILLGAGLSRWSPAEDAILAIDEEGSIDSVRFPAAGFPAKQAHRTRLATAVDALSPRFGARGRYVYWEDRDRSSTTVAAAATGDVVASWDSQAADSFYAGVYPIVATPQGPAAVLSVHDEGCRGTELRHPALAGGARCLDGGYVPRWSPDGRLLAYASGDELRLLEVTSGDERVLARGIDRSDYVEGALARWSPNGKYLLVQWPAGGVGWSEE